MKIKTLIEVAESPAHEIKKALRLEHKTPGRGIITIKTDTTPAEGDPVKVTMQLGDNEARVVMLAFVEAVTPGQVGEWRLLVRELAALLNRRISISLRSCTPQQVLAAISEKTGAHFVLPDSEWTKQDLPRFQHIGGGYGALDNLLRAFGVQNGTWQQQPDGRIYVGELEKSLVGGKVVEIEAAVFDDISTTSGTLPAIPRLRPGTKISIGGKVRHITAIDITDNTMRLHWVKNLQDEKLRGIQ